MSDQDTTVAALRALVGTFVDQRDWHQFHSPKNLSMSLAIEAAAVRCLEAPALAGARVGIVVSDLGSGALLYQHDGAGDAYLLLSLLPQKLLL